MTSLSLRQVVVDNVWQYVHIGAAAFLFYEDNLLGLYSLLGFASLCCDLVWTKSNVINVLVRSCPKRRVLA